MKVIFQDFGGCLNSAQEAVAKRHRRQRSRYWRWRDALKVMKMLGHEHR